MQIYSAVSQQVTVWMCNPADFYSVMEQNGTAIPTPQLCCPSSPPSSVSPPPAPLSPPSSVGVGCVGHGVYPGGGVGYGGYPGVGYPCPGTYGVGAGIPPMYGGSLSQGSSDEASPSSPASAPSGSTTRLMPRGSQISRMLLQRLWRKRA